MKANHIYLNRVKEWKKQLEQNKLMTAFKLTVNRKRNVFLS